MKTKILAITTCVLIVSGNVSSSLFADDKKPTSPVNPSLLEKLGGQSLKNKKAKTGTSSGLKTRGFTTRGIAPPSAKPAPVPVKTRKMIFSTRGLRGIPGGIQSFDKESTTNIQEIKAPAENDASDYGDLSAAAGEAAYELTYKVDTSSQLSATDIKFEKGSDELADQQSYGFLNELAATLQHPDLNGMKYVVEGHASAEGSASANQSLSQRRANAIFNYLTRSGVPEERIFPVGYGETEARFPETSPDRSLAQDRRVLIFKLED